MSKNTSGKTNNTIEQETKMIKETGQTVIKVSHISKEFRVFFDKGIYLKEKILFKNRRRYEDRKVLKDISFEVKQGEAIGLIGENGCGKSTTLKMLSRIMYPDSGTIQIKGRVSALIELGAGFHPDLSGRENIYTNAAIFGLSKEEIDKRLQTIIDFSELGEYIENPVRTYSSGMYMRLAFSVAINVDADVLLIDEILAVGDVAFQSKCFNKLREIKKKGTTIVIVSHSLGQIEQICDRSYWIEGGLIRGQGNPVDVHSEYLRYMSEKNGTLSDHSRQDNEENNELQPSAEKTAVSDKKTEETTDNKRWGNKNISFTSVEILDEKNKPTNKLRSGTPFVIKMGYQINRPIENLCVGIGIFRNDGLQCYGTNTTIDHLPIELKEPTGFVFCKVSNNTLLEGEYSLDVAFERTGGFPYDYYRECVFFSVHSEIKDVGVARLEHEWIT